DESMLDMGRVGGKPSAQGHDAHDSHDPHGAPAAHDSGHGHGHDDDAGHGGGHGHHGEPHESPPSMLLALVVLAAGSILVGFLGVPAALGGSNRFEHWLSPVTEAHASHGAEHAEKPAHGEPAAHGSEPAKEGHGHNPMEYVLMLVSIGAAF